MLWLSKLIALGLSLSLQLYQIRASMSLHLRCHRLLQWLVSLDGTIECLSALGYPEQDQPKT